MEHLNDEFRVAVPIERAYGILTDVELIAPCLPGAQLQEIEGDEYRGVVKVKVGPITASYKGTASFVERQPPTSIVLRAKGRDTRGQGNADATITLALAADGDGTKVSVTTELTVTGKVAQFGRSVLGDVSTKLLGQFVRCLEDKVLADLGAQGGSPSAGGTEVGTDPAAAPSVPVASENAGGGATAVASEGRREMPSADPEPVDLLATIGDPLARRLVPVVGAIVVVAFVIALRRRRHHG